MSKTNTSYFAFIQLLPLTSHALLIIVMFIFTKFILPWVPEVFLACGGNFQCSLKADTSIDQETRNRARKVSGTYGKFISKGKLKRSEVWCYITMVARIYRELFEQKNSFLHINFCTFPSHCKPETWNFLISSLWHRRTQNNIFFFFF